MMYQKNNDDTLYEYVFEEIEQGIEPVKSLWARAVALSEGNDNKAKSLYMQYRVQAIKDQLSILQIDMADLSKEELFELIRNGFTVIPHKLQIIKQQKAEAKEKAIKIAIEEEAKEESEKYSKFGGWLLIFAVFLVLGNLYGFLGVEKYFENESLNILKSLYKNGMDQQVTYFKAIAYMSFVSYGLLLMFTISFFRKHRNTKDIAIFYFGYGIIALPIIFFLQIKINPDTTNVMFLLTGTVLRVLFFLIMIRYFMVSERVKKTFINGMEKDDPTETVIGLVFGAIVIVSIVYGRGTSASLEHIIRNESMASTTRIISKDGIATDRATGLMWQDNTDAKTIIRDWQGAKEYCKNLNFAGHSDWRLPSQEELRSIVDKNNKPTIKKEFKNTVPDIYWSSTPYDDVSNDAHDVDFYSGDESGNYKYGDHYVRCVRDSK